MGHPPNDIIANDLFTIVDDLQTGFALYDEDLHLIFANKTIRDFLPTLYMRLDTGQRMSECLAAQVEQTFPNLNAEQQEKRVTHILNTIMSAGTLNVTTPTGRKLSSTYNKTHDGRYVIVTVDVTDRIEYEENLKREHRMAEIANAEKTEFLATMSHEIRTPLSSVSYAVQIMQKRICDAGLTDVEEFAEIALGSLAHLNTLVTDVLDLSKIEAGQIILTPTENSPHAVLKRVVKPQRAVAREKGIDVILAIDRNVPKRLVFDDVRVTQCVTNLVSNAIKFTAEGSVTVAAQFDKERHYLVIYVADTGIGIPWDEQASIFEKYAQAKSNNPHKHGGTGLGLAISKKLAHLMGGDITLVSEPQRGSIFTLTFAADLVNFTAEEYNPETPYTEAA